MFVWLFGTVQSKRVVCHKNENHRIKNRHSAYKSIVWADLIDNWVCGSHWIAICLKNLCESSKKLDEFLLPSWFCVLRAWLRSRDTVLSNLLSAGGYRLSGLCLEAASSQVEVPRHKMHKYYVLTDHHQFTGDCLILNPLLSHCLCTAEYSISILLTWYHELAGPWIEASHSWGRLKYHFYCLWQHVFFFPVIFRSDFGLWGIHLLCLLQGQLLQP